MTTLNDDYTQYTPSTAWIPLDMLAEQWGRFGCTNVMSPPALQATGAVFCALAYETEARQCHMAADQASRDQTISELETTLEALRRALGSWGEALTTLRILATHPRVDGLACLISEIMQQRLRLAALLQEVEQEQVTLYSMEKGGDLVVLPH